MTKLARFALFAALLGAALWTVPASAQSACAFIKQGAVLTAGQWNSCFQAKQDASALPSGLTLISTNNISAVASYSDTTSITSACDDYYIAITSLIPVSANVNPELLLHSNGAFQNTSYVNSGGGATTFWDLTANGANISNTDGGDFFIYLFAVNNASIHKSGRAFAAYVTSGAGSNAPSVAASWQGGTTVIDGFQLLMSSGNIASAKVKVYCYRPM